MGRILISIKGGNKMKKTILVFVLALVLSGAAMAGNTGDDQKEEEAIKKTIEDAYIKGIFLNRDIEAIRKGFHPDFTMLMKKDDAIEKVSIDKWIGWIEADKKKNPNRPTPNFTHKIPMVKTAGNAGVANVQVFKDGKHIYSDFMSLYKFSDGWKIVNKIYFSLK